MTKRVIRVGLVLLFLSACLDRATTPTAQPRLQALYVTMRDGVRIAIDVWLPEDLQENQKIPTIMRATRYWRAQDIVGATTLEQDSNYSRADTLNQAGYAYVCVDARGSGASFGTRPYELSPDEVRDYGEIVDWIVAQPWSNGRVGATGVSYDGDTAEFLMVNRHPAVKAVAPLYPDFNALDQLIYPGNVFLDFFTDTWGQAVWAMDMNDVCALQGVAGEACEQLKTQVRGVKPVDEDQDRSLLAEAVKDHEANMRVDVAAKGYAFRGDPWGPDGSTDIHELMAPTGHLEAIEESGTAIFTRVGWLDAATTNGALSRFNSISNPQRVVIGALSHGGGFDADPFRPADTPPDPPRDKQMENLFAFFEPYLKHDEPLAMESEITYTTFGSGRWTTTTVWPPEGFTSKDWYFGPTGTLAASTPTTADGADLYTVDYTATTGEQNRWHTQMGGGDVVYPDRAEEDNKLLTYTSPPMETDVEITGHPLVTLFIRSTHEDGAFFVYLEDVAPDGRVTYLTEGQLRAISRKVSDDEPPYFLYGPYRTFTREDAAPLVPGEVAELTFDLWAISALIEKGHRVRVAIAGADKDNFARYPPSGDPTITVERNQRYASKITLPMMDR
jgi:putative CocE/NonD family hydrolase